MKKNKLIQKMIPPVYLSSVGFNAGRINFHTSQQISGNATIKPPTNAMVILDINVPLMEFTCRFNFIGGIHNESPNPRR